MEQTIATFQADNSGDQTILLIALLTALFALAGMILLLRRKNGGLDRNRTLLLAMLAFFAFIIALGTAFFSWWSARKTGPVTVFTDAIETPYGRAGFADIQNAYLKKESQSSLINPKLVTGSVRLLIIEEKDGHAHVLSEQNYPVEQVMTALKDAVKTWQESRKEE